MVEEETEEDAIDDAAFEKAENMLIISRSRAAVDGSCLFDSSVSKIQKKIFRRFLKLSSCPYKSRIDFVNNLIE